ncbi:DUF4870 domain-containing protein [Natrinema pallidum]|uniref:DUF4870 domain-containing protein n=1 Tax=Natrinema pallidum DSM 3751 TaxID=1227495 RepID=L9YT11_9EURY|nr:DUF4870 domain-containing protein [Natrinema pallidum]ELY76597.1 hypothetical protein C487_10952 [Natrinema pallidum DSM 3751]
MSTNSSPTESPTTEPGPSILAERTLLGIFVHFIAILPFIGPIATVVIYLASSHEFTRANARNALDWHLFVIGSVLATFALLIGLDTLFEYVTVPGSLEAAVLLPVFVLVFAAMSLGLLSAVIWIVAMAKAIFGEAWRYPFAPELV